MMSAAAGPTVACGGATLCGGVAHGMLLNT